VAEQEFNEAGERAAYEQLALSEQDRRRLDRIAQKQRIENARLRRDQRARRDQDLAEARQEIVRRHNRPDLKPSWDKGTVLPRWKVEMLAGRLVQARNQRERDDLNAGVEREKNDIVSRSFFYCREAMEAERQQRKADRRATRYRSRDRDDGGRDR